MAKLEPQVDFANMSDADIAEMGLEAARVAFSNDVEAGYTNGNSLAIVVGEDLNMNGEWVELGSKVFGPDGQDFVENIDPETGKLATAMYYCIDSHVAYKFFEDQIPKGPQRWTGGVYFVAQVQTATQGWMGRSFVGAASGVQGHFDAATVYTALTRMSACWAQKMQALHGKP